MPQASGAMLEVAKVCEHCESEHTSGKDDNDHASKHHLRLVGALSVVVRAHFWAARAGLEAAIVPGNAALVVAARVDSTYFTARDVRASRHFARRFRMGSNALRKAGLHALSCSWHHLEQSGLSLRMQLVVRMATHEETSRLIGTSLAAT